VPSARSVLLAMHLHIQVTAAIACASSRWTARCSTKPQRLPLTPSVIGQSQPRSDATSSSSWSNVWRIPSSTQIRLSTKVIVIFPSRAYGPRVALLNLRSTGTWVIYAGAASSELLEGSSKVYFGLKG